MGRPERPLDPDADPVQRFAFDLRRLRHAAGLTYRQMAARTHYSVPALSQAAAGRELPSLPVTLAYVRACDGDGDEWTARWRAASGAAREVRKPADVESATPPYLGLATFQPEDHDRFFGRELLVDALCDRLAEQPVLALFGPSGSGKSSLVRAGLVPRTTACGSRSALLMTPTEHPLAELTVRLAVPLGLAPDAVDLAADPAGAERLVRQSMVGRPEQAETVLVVDQFEEVFTLCRDERERALFIDALLGIVLTTRRRARLVLGVRADFYGRCTEHPALLAALQDRQVLVGRMSADELRNAVVRPAVRAGLKVDPALVAAVVGDVLAGGGAGALPLLSHALLETWRHRRGATLTLAGYLATGGLRDALARTADQVYTGLAPDQRPIARSVLLRLVNVSEGAELTRRRARRAELVAGPDRPAVEAVLDTLTAARLITVTERGVELAHEALIGAWPTFRNWLADDRLSLRLHRGLTEAATDWSASGRDPSGLWRGNRLAAARDLAGEHALNELERSFLAASSEHERTELAAVRRRNRRLTVLTVGLAVLMVLAVGSTAVAVRQWQDAEDERDRAAAGRLAVHAQAATQQPLSLLLSLESLRLETSDRARAALLRGVVRPHHNTVVLGEHAAAVHAVAFSKDNRTLVSVGDDRLVRRWDVATGTMVGTPSAGHEDVVEGLVVSPDGRMIVSGGDDDVVRRWDAATGAPIGEPLRGHDASVKTIAMTPDGVIVSAGLDHTVRRWDADTGEPLGDPMRGHEDSVWSVAASADGRLIVSGSPDGTVRRWDAATGAPVGQPLRAGAVRDVAVSHDHSMIVSAGDDGLVRRWDAATGALIGQPLAGHTERVEAVAIVPNGRTIVSAGRDRTVRLWDTATGAPIGEPLLGHTDQVRFIAVSRDGTRIATGSRDQSVRIWDVAAGPPIGPVLHGVPDQFVHAALDPRQPVIVSGHADGALRRWDTGTGAPVGQPLTGHHDLVMGVAISRDGRLIVSGSHDTTVRRWDAATGAPVGAPLTGHGQEVVAVGIDRDATMIASAGWDRTVRRWDAATGASIGPPMTGHQEAINVLRITPDGRTIVTGDHAGEVRRWDAATGAPIDPPLVSEESVQTLDVSPDGTMIASTSGDTVRRWHVRTGAPIGEPLTGADGPVVTVAFTRDGDILSASHDGTVRRWDATTGAQLGRPLANYIDHLGRIAFSSDGALIGVAGTDRTIRVFPVDVDSWARHACRLAGRNLTGPEWDEYLGHDQPYRRTCPDHPPGYGADR
jgi:WD40 repeat protein/transcriptional regulator with XRE-family HTH domain